MRHTLGLLIILLSIGCSSLYAQGKDTVIIRRFTQKDGLSSYNIRNIIEDKRGFMWIATQEGLSLFDGKVFSNYNKNGPPGKRIGGTDVRAVIEDTSTNIIWVLPTEGRVNAINSVTGNVVTDIRIPEFGKEDYNLSMLKISNELWIGTSTGVRIYNIVAGKFGEHLSLPGKYERDVRFVVRSMLQDENGNVWVSYDKYGVVVYNAVTKSIIATTTLAQLGDLKNMNEIRVYAFLSQSSQMLAATSQGLRRIKYNNAYSLAIDKAPCILPILNQENIDWVAADNASSVLVSGYGHFYRFNNSLSSWQEILELPRTYESNWLSSVLCIYKDRFENTWLGCQEGLGFIRKEKLPFIPFNYDEKSKLQLEHVYCVSPISNGNILVGLKNGLVEINRTNGEYKRYDARHLYQHVFEDSQKIIHISRPDGLFVYKGEGKIMPVAEIYPEFRPFRAFSINSHLFINDSLVVMGTENNSGILLWNPKAKRIDMINGSSKPVRLASNIVNNVFKDSLGRIWVMSDNSITLVSRDLKSAKEIFLSNGKDSTEHGHFFDMCEAAGFYWIAAYGSGILKVNDKFEIVHVFNTQNGLSNDGVYQIYSLPNDYLIVTSNNGLSQIDIRSNAVNRYYVSDGLHSNAFEEVSGVMMNGKIYAGGVNGFTIIDPRNFLSNKTPPVLYFTGVEMQTKSSRILNTDLLPDHVEIANDVIQTTVMVSALNAANPGRLDYKYRIIERGNSWINNGGRNFISLTGLSPGWHTIEVMAVNENGFWSAPRQLRLYFQPKWFQTWWFKVLLAIIITGIGYQVFRLRIRQLRREEGIRRRIARDLHDDLGSTMNSINIYTNLAIMEDDRSKYLRKIKESTQEAMNGMRDIIWILDDKQDTIEQLAERVNRFAFPLCEANGVSLMIDMGAGIGTEVLANEEKRNLYLIIKEAINNSIKYAKSSQIKVSISLTNNKVEISIADNGGGFDVLHVKKGNGLDNIKRRSDEIGYHLSIQTAIGGGTSIFLSKTRRGL